MFYEAFIACCGFAEAKQKPERKCHGNRKISKSYDFSRNMKINIAGSQSKSMKCNASADLFW